MVNESGPEKASVPFTSTVRERQIGNKDPVVSLKELTSRYVSPISEPRAQALLRNFEPIYDLLFYKQSKKENHSIEMADLANTSGPHYKRRLQEVLERMINMVPKEKVKDILENPDKLGDLITKRPLGKENGKEEN